MAFWIVFWCPVGFLLLWILIHLVLVVLATPRVVYKAQLLGPEISLPPIEEEGFHVVSVVLGKAWDEKKANAVVGAGDVEAIVDPLAEHTNDDKEDTDVALISGLPELYAAELEEYKFTAAYGLRFNERLQAQLKEALDHIGAVEASTKRKEEELQQLHESVEASTKKEEELQQLHESVKALTKKKEEELQHLHEALTKVTKEKDSMHQNQLAEWKTNEMQLKEQAGSLEEARKEIKELQAKLEGAGTKEQCHELEKQVRELRGQISLYEGRAKRMEDYRPGKMNTPSTQTSVPVCACSPNAPVLHCPFSPPKMKKLCKDMTKALVDRYKPALDAAKQDREERIRQVGVVEELKTMLQHKGATTHAFQPGSVSSNFQAKSAPPTAPKVSKTGKGKETKGPVVFRGQFLPTRASKPPALPRKFAIPNDPIAQGKVIPPKISKADEIKLWKEHVGGGYVKAWHALAEHRKQNNGSGMCMVFPAAPASKGVLVPSQGMAARTAVHEESPMAQDVSEDGGGDDGGEEDEGDDSDYDVDRE
ncbi:unnamed protein product [Calypogeia fissa]